MNPVVSALVITYNQEDYIKDALNSILMQKVSFDYEIVVGEDCSTDNTRKILLEYQNKYPNKFNLILRDKNLGLMGNYLDTLSKCRGEYITLLAGDDYWTDPNKLQMQYDALKNNEGCSFAFHDFEVVNYSKKYLRKHSKGRVNELWESGEIDSRKIVSSPLMVPHPGSVMFRRRYLNMDFMRSLGNVSGEDYPTVVMLCDAGNGYYLNAVMGAYRIHESSISANRSYANNPGLIKEIVNTHNYMNNYFDKKFDEEINRKLRCQLMMKYESELHFAIQNNKIFEATRRLVIMLLKSRNSQYSFLDVLWIFKEKVKNRLA